MSGEERWRSLLRHDGYVEIRLRLLPPEEGGRDRALQSGFRARWIDNGDGSPLDAPIELGGARRSIKPGQEGIVRAFPLQPERWAGVAAGDAVRLHWKPGKVLGVGLVLAVVGVPPHRVPLEPGRVHAPAAVLLARRVPWRQVWRRSMGQRRR